MRTKWSGACTPRVFGATVVAFLCIQNAVQSARANAAVRVNEIAWMGTSDSSYCEWFELYNDSEDDTSLAGWKLYEGGGTTAVFTFSKTISAQEYLLVERTTATCPDPVPGVSGDAGSFGGSGFSNAGENLVLKDAHDTTVQSLDFSSGWPAGDAHTKETQQWNGSSWITAAGTPGAANATTGSDDSGDGGSDDGGSDSGDSGDTPTPKPKEKLPTYTPHITITAPKNVYSATPATYTAEVTLEHFKTTTGAYVWNMGDGTLIYHDGSIPVRYTYRYPGTYTITLGYFSQGPYLAATPELMQSIAVTVMDPTLTIATKNPGWLTLTNTASAAIDISGWNVVTPSQSAAFPALSTLAGKASISVRLGALGIMNSSGVISLATPTGITVASLPDKAPQDTPQKMVEKDSFDRSAEETVPSEDNAVSDVAATTPAEDPAPASPVTQSPKQKSHTNTLLYGIALLFVIGLSVLLERVMARRE